MQKRLFVLVATLISMTLIFTVFITPAPVSSSSQGDIDWHSYEEGTSKADRLGKPIFIDFMAEWCGSCQKMEEETYSDPGVQEKSGEVIFIKVDVDERSDLSSRYEISAVPTMVFESPEGEEVDRNVGFMSASELKEKLDSVISEFDDNRNDETDESVDLEEGSEEEKPFWKNFLFWNVAASLIAAVFIVMLLRRRKIDDKEDEEGDEG
ncbi:MAG: thioredoxin domain-containing protein [Candidatus Aenigmatarchaeota archaeon]